VQEKQLFFSINIIYNPGKQTSYKSVVSGLQEKFFLGMGALLFIIVGSLVYASLDSVPPDLVDNAAILGTLALVTGLLFLLDIGLSRPKPPPIKQLYKATQTDIASKSVDLLDKVHQVPNGDKVIGELRSSLKTRRRTDDDSRYDHSYEQGVLQAV
jgi:hypothetical protein